MEKTIIKMAKYYTRKRKATVKSTALKFGVSIRAITKYFTEDLKMLSPKLYGKVQAKKATNMKKVKSNFKKKACWLSKLFKKR